MTTDVLTVGEPAPGVAVVTLNRPEKRNALSADLKRALTEAARNLAERTDIGAVVVTGAGGAFTAGNDISEANSFAQELPLAEARRHIRLGLEMCKAWEALPQLSIAAIEGFCIGGGISLAVACDFRLFQRDAWLRAPEVELGITYSWGTLPRLVRLVGPQRAKLIAAVARKIDAETALAWGLCEAMADDVQAAALEMAVEIATKPRVAQQMIKESINRQTAGLDLGTLEQDQVLLNISDPETRALQAAVLERISKK
ncbi:MAG: enoyl-CoA hydratase/isomerase family protein [Alphaproteobacteria bacterium]|nr:enoyl-CoA hydratase/isomerase family protein [Alphaproteobacteria bacterium]